LIPCPACEGHGNHVTENPDTGRYRVRRCKWCDGIGATDNTTIKLFTRWLRVYNFNRAQGHCPLKGQPLAYRLEATQMPKPRKA